MTSARCRCCRITTEIVLPVIIPDCLHCGTAVGQYKLTIAGTTNGTCEDCDNLNGDHILTWIGAGCEWRKLITLCDVDYRIELHRTGERWIVFLTEIGAIGTRASWNGPFDNCTVFPVTMNRGTASDRCGWPETITLDLP